MKPWVIIKFRFRFVAEQTHLRLMSFGSCVLPDWAITPKNVKPHTSFFTWEIKTKWYPCQILVKSYSTFQWPSPVYIFFSRNKSVFFSTFFFEKGADIVHSPFLILENRRNKLDPVCMSVSSAKSQPFLLVLKNLECL